MTPTEQFRAYIRGLGRISIEQKKQLWKDYIAGLNASRKRFR